jgi:tetratricopeptide (TPR) repeat protein
MNDELARRRAASLLYSMAARHRRKQLATPEAVARAVQELQEGCITVLRGLAAGRRKSVLLGSACQLLGELYLSLGDVDSALDAFDAAIEAFKAEAGRSEEYGRFLHDLSVTMAARNLRPVALGYATEALVVLAPHGRRYRRDLSGWIATLTEQPGGGSDVALLRQRFRKAWRTRPRAFAAQRLAAELSTHDEAGEHTAEIHAAVEVAFREFRRRGSAEEADAALGPLLNLYWRGGELPNWTGDAATSLLAKAEAEGRTDLACHALTIQAGWLDRRGMSDHALDHALRAVARHDEHMLATGSSDARALTGQVGHFAREMALAIAVERGDGALAAELVESARLQVVPDSEPNWDVRATRDPVRDLRFLTVDGHSRLASYYTSGAARGGLSLEAAIMAVGGANACWWGTWVVNGRIYWALRVENHWSCGILDMTEHEGSLKRAFDVSMHNPSASTQDLVTGEWCRSATAEELFSAELGEILIPDELRARLLDADPDHPLSLVIAGNLSHLLPFPLLGVRRHLLDTPVRIVQAAVLRVAPPAALVVLVAGRPASLSPMHDIQLACVDPTANLKHSGQVPAGARTILSGRKESGLPAVTLEHVSAALRRSNPGQAGIFYYAGHARGSGLGGDADDSLVLSEDETISARKLFGTDGAAFPFPERSLLSACRSGGTAGAGAGEWLGLSAGLLWRGSRQVIATNWSIWDTAFTSAFDLDLVERLRSADDPARALRDAQLAAFENWSDSQHDYTEHSRSGLPGSSLRLPFPLIWGSYCCVGTMR